MKKIIFSLWLSLATILTATAQDFRVRVVNHLQMPISYAIITIEGAPRAVTDIDGVVDIDFRRIRPEHRLGAHAAGYQSVECEVGQEGMTSGTLLFQLPLNKGIVADTDVDRTSDQAREKFESAVGESTAMDFNCTFASRFEFEYAKHKAKGEFTVENLVDSKELAYFREKGWCHRPVDIRMDEGSSQSVIHKLDESIHYALSELNFAIAAIGHNRHFYKYKPDYALLGSNADETLQYYRISFPMLATKATQIVATVDTARQVITSIDVLISDRNTSIIKRITSDVSPVMPTKKSKISALCPDNLYYGYKTRYVELIMHLSDIVITPAAKKR
ncbi:MAG: hypothetical protein IIU85_04040 [Rikenellaceae bacterium]|nr:hypothetical protein [Rikenellaceae bacterium]